MNWYFRKEEKIIGPISESTLQELSDCGVISPGTEIRPEFEETWQPFDEHKLRFDQLAEPSKIASSSVFTPKVKVALIATVSLVMAAGVYVLSTKLTQSESSHSSQSKPEEAAEFESPQPWFRTAGAPSQNPSYDSASRRNQVDPPLSPSSRFRDQTGDLGYNGELREAVLLIAEIYPELSTQDQIEKLEDISGLRMATLQNIRRARQMVENLIGAAEISSMSQQEFFEKSEKNRKELEPEVNRILFGQ